jgi:hypothetical protein
MNELVRTGTIIVVFALVFYSIGIFKEQRSKKAGKVVLIFLTLGLLSDITATIFMINGSSSGPVTLHGFIGYSSLLGMLIDNILLWQLRVKNGCGALVPKRIHLYSRYAYIWWVLAFITGGVLVAIR